ncbi:DUF2306 domain-containing protein [Nocardiopsis oceani]
MSVKQEPAAAARRVAPPDPVWSESLSVYKREEVKIAPLSHSGLSTAISNTVWAILWLTFTVIGYRMVRQRRYARHREWMLRSFVLVYAIALNRVIVFALILGLWPFVDVQDGADMAEVGLAIAPASSFLSWILPLLLVEWWLQYRKPRRRTRHARATRENGATSSTPAPFHTD